MKSLLFLTSLVAVTLAAPTQSSYEWTPALAEFYSVVDKHIQDARAAGVPTPPTCDLTNAKMPVAPTPLPVPAAGLKLSAVVIGRGQQVRRTNNSTKLWP